MNAHSIGLYMSFHSSWKLRSVLHGWIIILTIRKPDARGLGAARLDAVVLNAVVRVAGNPATDEKCNNAGGVLVGAYRAEKKIMTLTSKTDSEIIWRAQIRIEIDNIQWRPNSSAVALEIVAGNRTNTPATGKFVHRFIHAPKPRKLMFTYPSTLSCTRIEEGQSVISILQKSL